MRTPKILEGLSRGTVLLLAVLVALLVATLGYSVSIWTAEQAQLPPFIWGALAGGVFFSLVVGVGLMTLIFYSSRAGYDDAPQLEQQDEPLRADELSRRPN